MQTFAHIFLESFAIFRRIRKLTACGLPGLCSTTNPY